MHLPKTFFRSFLFSILSVLIFFNAPVLAAPTGGTLVSTINIRDAQILSQKDNNIAIGFTLTNREGMQNDVRYGVQLISETTKGKFVVDEKVFEDRDTITENSSTQKIVSYTAPSTLTGSYEIVLVSKNSDNFLFALSSLGKISISASQKGMVIAPESCSVALGGVSKTYSLKDVLVLGNSAQKIILTCSASNTSTVAVSTVPTVITNISGSYGELIETELLVTPAFTFKAGEKKNFSIVIPVASKPQKYVASLSFVTGDVRSNTISLSYILPGVSATISKLSLDKDFYKRGEVAALSLIWLSQSPNLTLSATLTNGSGMNCAKKVEQNLSGSIEVLFPINTTCRDPQVKVAIKDASGQVLDEKEFSVKTPNGKGYGDTMPFVVLIVMAALIVLWMYIKRHKKVSVENPPSNTIPMRTLLPIIIVTSLLSLIPFQKASADVYTSMVNGVPCVESYVDITDRTYTPPVLDIEARWLVTNNCGIDVPVTLRAVNNINAVSPAVNPSAVLQTPLTLTANGGRTGGGFISTNNASFDAPSASGTYQIEFETGVEVAGSVIVYVKTTEIGYDSGYITLPVLQGLGCGYYNNPTSQYLNDYYYFHTTYKADFYSDPGMMNPLDVSGLNFQLKQDRYYSIPAGGNAQMATEIVYTPVPSGTSFTYAGYSVDSGYTDQYGPSSCDTQDTHSGYATLEGTSVIPTPYMLIPEPPVVYISGPTGAYTGSPINISWNSPLATSCIGTNITTNGNITGTQEVTQSTTTTYTVSCSNISGTDSKSITVADLGIYVPPPTCNQWPGQAAMCDAPAYCAADPMHPGYEICQF
jgi:hypothetical protein